MCGSEYELPQTELGIKVSVRNEFSSEKEIDVGTDLHINSANDKIEGYRIVCLRHIDRIESKRLLNHRNGTVQQEHRICRIHYRKYRRTESNMLGSNRNREDFTLDFRYFRYFRYA